MTKPTFTKIVSGRAGTIIYKDGEHSVSIDWEMSGSPKHDILMGPIDLSKWDSPREEDIPREIQKDIIQKLRIWLKEQNLKSDIDLKEEVDPNNLQCVWKDCSKVRMNGSAYCSFHIDETTLKN